MPRADRDAALKRFELPLDDSLTPDAVSDLRADITDQLGRANRYFGFRSECERRYKANRCTYFNEPCQLRREVQLGTCRLRC